MNNGQNQWLLSIYATFVLVALLIVVDFIIPGQVINEEIIDVKKERQQYYNAAANYHYSYKVITRDYQFWVGDEFDLISGEGKIEFTVSRIFQEVNRYRLLSSEKWGISYIRIISGIVVPFLSIISIAVAYFFNKNIDILVFVLQVLLIADLVFLLM